MHLAHSAVPALVACALAACGARTSPAGVGAPDAATGDARGVTRDASVVDATDGAMGIDAAEASAADVGGGDVEPPEAATDGCVAKTCTDYGYTCGTASDGCGHVLDCGVCGHGMVCGGPCGNDVHGGLCGAVDVCSTTACCCPMSCESLGVACGNAGDGCGGLLQCGTCAMPETCGGGGHLGLCGPDPSCDAGCCPKTCAQLGFSCGQVSDYCGGALDCGTCLAPDYCGGGGVTGRCGHP